jgi:predicted MFS family arabinose efflux permease
MTLRKLKAGFFFLEASNAYATAYYFNYLFFYMKELHGLGNLGNLALCALNGLVYLGGSWLGGKFAQRFGYFTALRLGFGLMSACLVAGSFFPGVAAQALVMACWTVGVSPIWPSLEALVCEGENRPGLQRMVGLYNIMWSGGSALAYFSGGALLKILGMQSLFWLPVGIHLLQLAVTGWLKREHDHFQLRAEAGPEDAPEAHPLPPNLSLPPQTFLLIAWVANPFCYVAINTVVALMPDLAARFHLSLAMAGFFCSIWYFVRLGAFILLWLWAGWHYRFRWIFGAYVAVIASFAGMLLLPGLGFVIAAQLVFGMAVCLVYYSSLFYSMDAGETKGEHGGFHEAAIGAGIFTGPALGATCLYLFPRLPNLGIWAVSGLLVVGAAVMLRIRATHRRS